MLPIELLAPPLAGLLLTIGAGFGVGRLLKHAKKTMPLPPPSSALAGEWAAVVAGNESGALLCHLERILFFFAIWLGAESLVAVWLAFKVASKWNAWANVIAVPKELPGVGPLEFLRARRHWGSHVLMTFLLGTLANLVVGLAGAAVAKHGLEVTRALCG